MANINFNSLRNKFEEVKNLLSIKLDITGISETKLDDSFPTSNSLLMTFLISIALTEISFVGRD